MNTKTSKRKDTFKNKEYRENTTRSEASDKEFTRKS